VNGIVFFRTSNLSVLRDFYTRRIGCEVWLDQGDCVILRHGNLLVGFCERTGAETQGMVTFFYGSRAEVDEMHRQLTDVAEAPPRENPKYRIYQFFARDPEGRALEFQHFDEGAPPLQGKI